jgi:hypothetical protein
MKGGGCPFSALPLCIHITANYEKWFYITKLKTIITCFGTKMSHAEHAKAKKLLVAYVHEQIFY